MLSRILGKVMDWAIARNGPGGYRGEDDPRWAYVIESPDGSPYLSRLLLPRVTLPFGLGSFRPMIHKFHRPDVDNELHNHPWKRAVSVVLDGAYDEERLTGDPRPDRYMNEDGQCVMCGLWRGECEGHPADRDLNKVRRFNVLSGDDYHRVVKLHGDVWTLFIAGEPKPDDEWGFLIDETGEHMPSQEYVKTRGQKVH